MHKSNHQQLDIETQLTEAFLAARNSATRNALFEYLVKIGFHEHIVARLWTRHHDTLCKYHSGLETEDLTQEVQLAMLKALDTYEADKGTSVRTWLRIKCYWTGLDKIKATYHISSVYGKIEIQSLDERLPGAIGDNYSTLLADILFEDNVERVDVLGLKIALESLTPKELHIIQRYYYDGLKFSEIAKEFGMSQTAISNCHKTALKKLRYVLGNSVAN